jgi:hypothetical protein
VAEPYRNGSETLIEWRQWKEQVWTLCPFGVTDKTKCNARLCPCALLRVNRWVNAVSGYLGTVKLVKFLHGRNGNGQGSGRDQAKAE